MTALTGLRVVELSNERCAFAGKLLADMGAEVNHLCPTSTNSSPVVARAGSTGVATVVFARTSEPPCFSDGRVRGGLVQHAKRALGRTPAGAPASAFPPREPGHPQSARSGESIGRGGQSDLQ